jgi:hypothetical protein
MRFWALPFLFDGQRKNGASNPSAVGQIMRILVKAIMGVDQSVGIGLENEGHAVGSILLTPEVARWVAGQILAAANEVEARGGTSDDVARQCKMPNPNRGAS